MIEISSYQLELTPSLQPDIAVILNLSADHLDRHGGWDGYLAAKRQILAGLAVNGLAILGPGPALDEMAATLSGGLMHRPLPVWLTAIQMRI